MDKGRGGWLAAVAAAVVGAGALAAVLGTPAVTHHVETAGAPAALAAAPVPGPPAVPGTEASTVPVTSTTAAVPVPPQPSPGPSSTVTTLAAPSGYAPSGYYHPDAAGPAGSRVAVASTQPANPLDGLVPPPAGWAATVHTIDVANMTRTYLTVEPQSLTGSVPVLVLMHGVAMDATGVLNLTKLAAQTGPAVILAPEGWQESWNAGGCCGPAFRAGIDDVDFIQAAVAQVLAATPQANPARVYAVGFSNGGRMAYHLACDLPGTFAGFVAAEAVPVDRCSSEHPLDVMIIAQQADPLLSVDADQPPKWVDGSPEPTVAATVARQQAIDGCSGDPTLTYAGVAEIRSWGCAAGTSLTYVWYPGGSHSWRVPSGATPGATDMVLKMLGGQQLTDRPAPVS